MEQGGEAKEGEEGDKKNDAFFEPSNEVKLSLLE